MYYVISLINNNSIFASCSLILLVCGSDTHAFNRNICHVLFGELLLLSYYTLLLQDTHNKLHGTEQRECVKCVKCNIHMHTRLKTTTNSMWVAHPSSSSVSLRFRGDDRRHRHRYYNHSRHTADHPEDVQQVGPHSCLTGESLHSECHEQWHRQSCYFYALQGRLSTCCCF